MAKKIWKSSGILPNPHPDFEQFRSEVLLLWKADTSTFDLGWYDFGRSKWTNKGGIVEGVTHYSSLPNPPD